MESITHIQSSLYGESEPRVLREGCGYSSYTLGSGRYTPRIEPWSGLHPCWAGGHAPKLFGPPPPIHQSTHLVGCPAVRMRRAHAWSAVKARAMGSRTRDPPFLGRHASECGCMRVALATTWKHPTEESLTDGTGTSGPRGVSIGSGRIPRTAVPWRLGVEV